MALQNMKMILIAVSVLTGNILLGETAVLHSIEIFQDAPQIGLFLRLEGDPQATISEEHTGDIRVRFENTVGYTFEKTNGLLWSFVPVSSIKLTQQYNNVYLKIRIPDNVDYVLSHKQTNQGIVLYLSDEFGRKTAENAFQYAQNRWNNLDEEKKAALKEIVYSYASQFTIPELENMLDDAKNKDAPGWTAELVQLLRHRNAFTTAEKKSLAKYLEQTQQHALAENMWYEFYTESTKGDINRYVEALPWYESPPTIYTTNRVQQENTSTPVLSLARFKTKGLIVLLLVLGSTLGYWLIVVRRDNHGTRQGITKEESQDFLTALQAKIDADTISVKPIDQSGHSVRSTGRGNRNREYTPRGTRDSATATDISSRYRQNVVRQLIRDGLSIEQITQQFGVSRGEVELLIKLENLRRVGGSTSRRNRSIDARGMSTREVARKYEISEEEAKLLQVD